MPNYLAISTVTAVVKYLLSQQISVDIRNIPFTVTSNPPDVLIDQPAANRINVFLYNVTRNTGYSNLYLPARSNITGELIQRQQLGLNLSYMITVYASDNDDLLAHRLLASAMRILDENPILTKQTITDAIKSLALAGNNITGSDLVDQVDLVKLSFHTLSLDEITKLWSSLYQTHYRLSIVYEATVVLLDSIQQPKATVPVQERQLYVAPFFPVIEKIDPQIVEYTAGSNLSLAGQNLQADGVIVQIDGSQVIPSIENISDNKISVTIPPGLGLGIKQVQISYPADLNSSSPSPMSAATAASLGPKVMQYKSNVAAFTVLPRITTASKLTLKNRRLIFTFEPPVTAPPQISVMLDNNVFLTSAVLKTTTNTKVTVNIPSTFPAKVYLLRVLIGDAVSLLRIDNDKTSSNYNNLGPVVEVK